MIPLDFVAGTHGHFLEYLLNRVFGYVQNDFDPFTNLGTSHNRPADYIQQRQIKCAHWYDRNPDTIKQSKKVIRIVFRPDDLLTVTSISLLRVADQGIDNDHLQINTVNKLDNAYYRETLRDIYQAYPFLDHSINDIPRNVLREYFKFGFRDYSINGYWKELQRLCAIPVKDAFSFDLCCLYDLSALRQRLKTAAGWLDQPIVDDLKWLESLHQKFVSSIPYLHHKFQCDQILQAIESNIACTIPALSMLQESYINGRLEAMFGKEMPFHSIDYFTSTQDVLKYLHTQAPAIYDTN